METQRYLFKLGCSNQWYPARLKFGALLFLIYIYDQPEGLISYLNMIADNVKHTRDEYSRLQQPKKILRKASALV